jgi:hypothetical protein
MLVGLMMVTLLGACPLPSTMQKLPHDTSILSLEFEMKGIISRDSFGRKRCVGKIGKEGKILLKILPENVGSSILQYGGDK